MCPTSTRGCQCNRKGVSGHIEAYKAIVVPCFCLPSRLPPRHVFFLLPRLLYACFTAGRRRETLQITPLPPPLIIHPNIKPPPPHHHSSIFFPFLHRPRDLYIHFSPFSNPLSCAQCDFSQPSLAPVAAPTAKVVIMDSERSVSPFRTRSPTPPPCIRLFFFLTTACP